MPTQPDASTEGSTEAGNAHPAWLMPMSELLKPTWVRHDGNPELDRKDVQRCSTILGQAGDRGWLAFSSHEAEWISFNMDSAIRDAYNDEGYNSQDRDITEAWMQRAKESIIDFIIRQIIAKPKRAALYRSLGRGWIFILLMRPQKKFRWWFESTDRVVRNHQEVIAHICKSELRSEEAQRLGVDKYTRGYIVEAEVVFVLNGLVPRVYSPQISIMRISPSYRHRDQWCTDEAVQRAVDKPQMSDEERIAHMRNAEKSKARRQKKKASNKEKAAAAVFDEDAAAQDALTFEQLLAEMKCNEADGSAPALRATPTEGRADGGGNAAPMSRDGDGSRQCNCSE